MLAGTYLGLVEKLDYLQALGINAVELLPVQEFNELEYYQVPSISCKTAMSEHEVSYRVGRKQRKIRS